MVEKQNIELKLIHMEDVVSKFSWNDKAALFYGFVSEDALKSYFRAENYKTPPLSKLDEMAEALGKPTYELIKEVEPNEKTNT